MRARVRFFCFVYKYQLFGDFYVFLNMFYFGNYLAKQWLPWPLPPSSRGGGTGAPPLYPPLMILIQNKVRL